MATVNKHQFGKSKACEHLAEELNRLGDSKHIRVCGRIITELREGLVIISSIKNSRQKSLFYNLLLNHNLNLIKNSAILNDQSVINFLSNVIIAIIRSYAKENKL